MIFVYVPQFQHVEAKTWHISAALSRIVGRVEDDT